MNIIRTNQGIFKVRYCYLKGSGKTETLVINYETEKGPFGGEYGDEILNSPEELKKYQAELITGVKKSTFNC